MRYASALSSILLAGCGTVQYVDRPRTVEVKVPVVAPIPPELIADCQPTPLAGTTVGAALDRLASTEDCLATMRSQAAQLRAVH